MGGSDSLEAWQSRLHFYICEVVGQLRISQMFDIVVDYPDSLPAVEDMRVCLRHTNLHHKFVTQFRKATQERLLHPGGLFCIEVHRITTGQTARGGGGVSSG